MFRLKIVAFAVAVFALSALVVSCGRPKEEGEVTLTMWIMPNSAQPEADMQEVLSRFLAENPGIKVNVEVLDWGAAWTRISTAATSGEAPDLVQLGTTWTSQFSAMGAFLEIDDLATEVGGAAAFVDNAWTYAKPVFSKNVTSLPWIVDVRPMFYRRDVFEKVGITTEDVSTWDGFRKSLEAIKAADLTIEGQKVAPIGFPGKNDWNVVHNLAPWIWGAGGDFISATGDRSLLNTEETLNGIMFYIDMIKAGLMPKDYLERNTAQLSTEFDQGRIATWFEPTSKYIYLNRPPEMGGASNTIGAQNYGVTLIPQGPKGRYAFLGGSNLAIFRVSQHPEQAKKLLRYLTTDVEAQIGYFKKSGMLPAYKEAFEDPYFENDNIRRTFKELTKYGRAYPSVPFWAELETSVLTVHLGAIYEYITLRRNEEIKREDIAKMLEDASLMIDNVIKRYFEQNPEHKAIVTSSKEQN